MTARAIKPEFSVVYIIGPVTVAAAASELAHRGERLSMAIIAGHADMGPVQLEIRLRVVIELPFGPVHRVVTVRTSV